MFYYSPIYLKNSGKNQCITIISILGITSHFSGMSWDALLKKTKIKLELLMDINMHLLMEKRSRDGISMVSKRFAKANNSQSLDYDNSKPNNWLMHLDAKNLYGWAMKQYLPVGRFQWDNKTIDEISATPDNEEYGCILEADIKYPEHLHDASAYPPTLEAIVVPELWISDYQYCLVNELGGKSLNL